MDCVLAFGGSRPGLGAEVAKRGLRLAAALDPRALAAVRFVPAVCPAVLPLLLVVEDGDAAVAAAIDAGADDAVPASASDALIAARLAAMARRAPPAALRLGDLAIDRVEQRVTRGGRVLDLLPREYRLLLHLAVHAGRAVPRDELRRGVWGLDFDPGTNLVAVHVSRLRAKLDRGFAEPLLMTDPGVGYRLAAR